MSAPGAHTWPALLTRLLAGDDLSADETSWAMREMMSGDATPAQIGGFLVALRAKGETVTELRALADIMLEHAVPISVDGPTLDIVGTGGDMAGTVNISTMSAICIAAAGVRVVKHGNRASSSKSGSADVLESLGVSLSLPADVVGEIADQIAALISPLVAAMRRWPEPATWVAREILFGEHLPHRREVLVLVEKLEDHIARMLAGCRPAASDADAAPLDVGARMIVTSGLAELNRARQGRAELDLVLERMREIVALVAAGVGTAHAPAHDAAVPASPESAR